MSTKRSKARGSGTRTARELNVDHVQGPWRDIRALSEDLKDISVEWFDLGEKLGIALPVLRKIEADFRGTDRCRLEMLDYWQQNDGSPNTLLSSLCKVGKHNLARKLQHKYSLNLPLQSGPEPESPPNELFNPTTKHSRDYIKQWSSIHQQDHTVRVKYTKFMIKVRELLERKKVPVQDLLYAVTYLSETQSVTAEMEKAGTIISFMAAFKTTQTWYDFELTASLAKMYAGKDGEDLVKAYEGELNVYFTDRFNINSPLRAERFVAKFDYKREKFTEDKILKFRALAGRILNCSSATFVLKSVKKYAKNSLQACSSELEKSNVISVTIGGELVWSLSNNSDIGLKTSDTQDTANLKPKSTIYDQMMLQHAKHTTPRRDPDKRKPLVTRSVPDQTRTQATYQLTWTGKTRRLARVCVILAVVLFAGAILYLLSAFLFSGSTVDEQQLNGSAIPTLVRPAQTQYIFAVIYILGSILVFGFIMCLLSPPNRKRALVFVVASLWVLLLVTLFINFVM